MEREPQTCEAYSSVCNSFPLKAVGQIRRQKLGLQEKRLQFGGAQEGFQVKVVIHCF